MNVGILALFVLIPVLLIVGIYRLLAFLTGIRPIRHRIKPPEENERKLQRVFNDE